MIADLSPPVVVVSLQDKQSLLTHLRDVPLISASQLYGPVVQSQLQVPPTPRPPPPPILATVTVPLGCFTHWKPGFTRTVLPTSSTPCIRAGKLFTKALPAFGA